MRIGIVAGLLALAAAAPSRARGAVVLEERSRMELAGPLGELASRIAGPEASGGETRTVAASATRKATLSKGSGEIVDLAEGRIYHLDARSRTYTVATFEELRRKIADARRRAAGAARSEAPPPEPRRAREPRRDELLSQLEIEVEQRATGRTRDLLGSPTREVVLRITAHERGKTVAEGGGLAVTSSMWLAPKVAALRELEAFDRRHAQALAGILLEGAGSPGPETVSPVAAHPMLKDVLVRLRTEGEQVDGTPLLTELTVDLLPSAQQEAELAAERRERQRRASRPAKVDARGGLGGLLGGIASRAVERKVEAATEREPSPTLLRMTTEVVRLSTRADPAELRIPAGYREVR